MHAVADAAIEAVLGAVVQVHGVEAPHAMEVAGAQEHEDVALVSPMGGTAGGADAAGLAHLVLGVVEERLRERREQLLERVVALGVKLELRRVVHKVVDHLVHIREATGTHLPYRRKDEVVAGKLANQPVKPLPIKHVSHGLPSLPRPRAHVLSCLKRRLTRVRAHTSTEAWGRPARQRPPQVPMAPPRSRQRHQAVLGRQPGRQP